MNPEEHSRNHVTVPLAYFQMLMDIAYGHRPPLHGGLSAPKYPDPGEEVPVKEPSLPPRPPADMPPKIWYGGGQFRPRGAAARKINELQQEDSDGSDTTEADD